MLTRFRTRKGLLSGQLCFSSSLLRKQKKHEGSVCFSIPLCSLLTNEELGQLTKLLLSLRQNEAQMEVRWNPELGKMLHDSRWGRHGHPCTPSPANKLHPSGDSATWPHSLLFDIQQCSFPDFLEKHRMTSLPKKGGQGQKANFIEKGGKGGRFSNALGDFPCKGHLLLISI